MNFETENTQIKETVLAKLKEIEQKEQIKILHAVESGSRAWGPVSYTHLDVYKRQSLC